VGLDRRGLGQGEGRRFVIKRCVLVTAGTFGVVGQKVEDLPGDLHRNVEHVLVARTGQRVEADRAALGVLDEDAVGDQDMKVDVQVELATEALNERDRAWLAAARDVAPPGQAALPGEDRANQELVHARDPRPVPGQPVTDRARHGEDPLPVARRRQDSVDQVSRAIGHSPGRTRGA
jgi:hypothetical protein